MPAQRGKPGDAREGLKVGDKPLEYNMAAPRRRYAEVVGMLAKATDSPMTHLVWANQSQHAVEQAQLFTSLKPPKPITKDFYAPFVVERF